MLGLQIKKNKILNILRLSNLNDTFEIYEESGYALFTSIQNLTEEANCVVSIVIDETIYSIISITFLELRDLNKKLEILELINKKNLKYKAYRFFLDDNNQIGVQMTFISRDEDFNSNLILESMLNLFNDIKKCEYHEFKSLINSYYEYKSEGFFDNYEEDDGYGYDEDPIEDEDYDEFGNYCGDPCLDPNEYKPWK